ncbi:hypothetical protein [Planktothricoides raciborskii]|uniref:hypothetical protein n=1 Tax=Planktothricoides raciborskii TaxID=132608 RepID=UPI0016891500|nr:hypothetical protein [Planktothricoides raciborskii]
MGIKSYLWDAIKKPGFWGSGGGCWGKETGFLLLVSGVICGSEKETRFLGFWGWLLGQRNRVSGVRIRSYLWDAKKKPGFCCWGKETGIKVVNITAIFSASKPQIPVGAKHSGRQIIA